MTPEQEALVLDNMKLVYHLANRYKARLAAGNSYDYEDLVSEGKIALILAAQRFDPDTGYKFSTYASSYIDGTMKSFLNCKVPTVHFGSTTVRIANQMIRDGLVDASPAEIAEALGITENTAKAAKEYIFNKRSRSFEEPVSGECENITLGETLNMSEEVDFDKELIIENFIQALGDRDSKVASMLLAGADQRQLAEEFRLARSTISKIFRRLLEKAEQYSREGEIHMSKIATLRKAIPKEKLKELLLENKTSIEIGAMFGYARSEIEVLKKDYGLSKAALGIHYFDREDKKIMDNKTETVESITETPEPVQTDQLQQEPAKMDQPQPEQKSVTVDQPLQEQETVKLSSAQLLEMLGKEGRIVINAQSVVINIGA